MTSAPGASPCGRPRRSTCSSGSAPRAPTASTPLVTVYQAISLYDDLTVDRGGRPDRRDRRGVVHRREPPAARRPQHRRPRGGRAGRAARPPGRRRRSASTSPSRSRAGWPVARPTGRRRWSPSTGCTTSGPPTTTCSRSRRSSGSDVPFALLGGTALGEGHGEVVTPLDRRGRPGGGSSCRPTTGCRRRRSTATTTRCVPTRRWCPDPPDEILAALASGDPRRLAAALHNDLEQAGVRPPPRPRRADRARASTPVPCAGCCRGPGRPACSSARPRDHARSVAATLSAGRDARVVLVAHGPVAGAHVVTGDEQPGQPGAGLQGVRRAAAARPTSRSGCRRGSGSASSVATATARPRCCRC